MKNTLMLAILAITPALLAAEPNTSATSLPASAPLPQEDIAEQAALVQQIGQEAARGFDPEAHAHALRVQIESLVSTPVKAPPPAKTSAPAETPRMLEPTTKPAPTPPAPIAPTPPSPRESIIREALQKLRAAIATLETELPVH